MRPLVDLSPLLAAGRIRDGAYASTDLSGATGMFHLRHQRGRLLRIMSSEGADWASTGMPFPAWEHVSVSLADRPAEKPSWAEMSWVKDLFWGEEELVLQFHPPRASYVNYHAGCLHLWRSLGVEVPLPPMLAVGPAPKSPA